jgi:hypothetical protein
MSKYQYTPGPRMGEPEFPNNLDTSMLCQNLSHTITINKSIADEVTLLMQNDK